MIYYILGAVLIAILLGIVLTSSHFWHQGYGTAVDDIRQQTANSSWAEFINKMQGGSDDEQG
jgi:hypothetical protein